MPAAWVGAAVGVYNALGGSGGGGGGGSPPYYTPTGLGAADWGWQQNQAYNQGQLGYGGPVPIGGLAGPNQYANISGTGGGLDPYGNQRNVVNPATGLQLSSSGPMGGLSGNPNNAEWTGGGSGGGGGGGGAPSYAPFGGGAGTGQGLAGIVDPLIYGTLQQQQGINYNPYLQASNFAGQAYGGLAGLAGQQMGQYGQAANIAQGQQAQLYGAGNQIYQNAFDPQQQLFQRTQQQLSDQINAGQAQRGLGVSAQGAGEFNQAMSDFDINWQNNQLNRQAQGIQSMAQANRGGMEQGQLFGANLSGQMGAGQQIPGFVQQSAQTPLSAQQYVAGMPAQNAAGYVSGITGAMAPYLQQQSAAIPYMNFGQGAQQQNYQNMVAQNSANANLLGQLGQQAYKSYNTPGGWLNNMFGGGSGGTAGTGGYQDPGTGNWYNNPSAYTPS